MAKKTEFNSEIMHNRADKLTDVLIETFGYSNTYLLLSYSMQLTESKQLKHHNITPEISDDTEDVTLNGLIDGL